MLAARRALCRAFLRRLWQGWAFQWRLGRDQRVAERLRGEMAATKKADAWRTGKAMVRWAAWAQTKAFEARSAKHQAELWRKVNSWLVDEEDSKPEGSEGEGGVEGLEAGLEAGPVAVW